MNRLRVAASIGFVLIGMAGCSTSSLPTSYGRRTGPGSASSINGTAVLADMFKGAGHHVESRHALSSKLDSAQTIVWFPNSFSPPSDEVCEWLANWLDSDPERTLVYVGRDFDAETGYWKQVLVNAPASQSQAIKDRIVDAEDRIDFTRSKIDIERKQCQWFSIDPDAKQRQVDSLSGPWSKNIDPKKIKIELQSRLKPIDDEYNDSEILLASEGDVLVSRLEVDPDEQSGAIILVANGSFLLNLPLVEHEHRKLAGKLVDEVHDGNVVFLESGVGGPRIGEEQPGGTGLEVLTVWPLSAILLHLAALGIIFSFARFPIFGSPLSPAVDSPSDFGKHVEALGALVAKTHDRGYAHKKIRVWREAKADEH